MFRYRVEWCRGGGRDPRGGCLRTPGHWVVKMRNGVVMIATSIPAAFRMIEAAETVRVGYERQAG